MQYRFSDLVDLAGFQQVMQSWYSVVGVATALLDMDRTSLCAVPLKGTLGVGWQDICARFHHLSPQTERRCNQSDDAIFSHLHQGPYVATKCSKGLMNCAMPVIVKGEQVATLFMGQFLHEPPDLEFFRRQAQELGVDEQAYLAAIRQVPIISQERLLVVMAAQTRLAQTLATLGLERAQLQETSAALNADLVKAQQHIALMLHTAQTTSSSLKPTQVLERVADAMVTAIGVPYCDIYLMDAERGVLVPHVVRGPLTEVHPNVFRQRHLDPAVDSLAGEALQRQAPAVWYDAETDPRISRETVQAWKVKSVLAVPIRVSEQVLGIAILSTTSDYRHFTSDEIELVWGIANSAALAVDNARLYEETRQRLAESEGLQRVAAALLHQVSLEEVLEIVCTEAQQLTGATGSAVLLLDTPRDEWLRVAHSTGTVSASFDRIPVEGSFAGIAVRRDEPFLTNDPAGEAYEYFGDERPTAFLAMPLHANGDVIGVLYVVDKPGGFCKDDARIVSLFANQAAINIEHARLNQQAGQLAVLEERQRLARELHDSVVQSLYSMTLYADAAALAFVAGKQDVTVNHLQELRNTARGAMHDMRLLIFELHPPALEQEGLVAALQIRLAAVEARAGLQTELTVEGERRLPIVIEQELYRIAQEALNNVMKHARAHQVTIRLQFTDKTVCLQVRDDGIGFDPHTARNAGGMGLRSFEERAAKMGGQLTLESSPGEGTTVTVEIGTRGNL
jgi:signal transduction histidine kinase/ligand-binding sensor protein